MAERLSMPVLARAWQMLLKGLGEVQAAPQPLAGRGDGADPPDACRRPADPGRPGAALAATATAPPLRAAAPRRERPTAAVGSAARPAPRLQTQQQIAPQPAAARSRRCVARRPQASLPRAAELRRGGGAVRRPARGHPRTRICNPTCIWCASSRAASSSAPASARRATCRTGSARCSRNGPASAGWSASPPEPGEPTLSEQAADAGAGAAREAARASAGAGGARRPFPGATIDDGAQPGQARGGSDRDPAGRRAAGGRTDRG